MRKQQSNKQNQLETILHSNSSKNKQFRSGTNSIFMYTHTQMKKNGKFISKNFKKEHHPSLQPLLKSKRIDIQNNANSILSSQQMPLRHQRTSSGIRQRLSQENSTIDQLKKEVQMLNAEKYQSLGMCRFFNSQKENIPEKTKDNEMQKYRSNSARKIFKGRTHYKTKSPNQFFQKQQTLNGKSILRGTPIHSNNSSFYCINKPKQNSIMIQKYSQRLLKRKVSVKSLSKNIETLAES